MITQFILAMFATLGCCIIFHLPKRCMPASAVLGAIGWVTCQIAMNYGLSMTLATFLAALLVAMIGESFARILKDAATLFVIPGIIPLVPGGCMYYAMLYFIQGDSSLAGEWAAKAFMTAAAIAIALLVMSSVINIIVKIYEKVHSSSEE